VEWTLGLDLGQASDYSALVALEQAATSGARHYAARHLERFPLGTSYPAVSARIRELVSAPPLADCRLVVDQTGVGRAVVDLLRQEGLSAWVMPITITSGHAIRWDGSSTHVPKRELVGVLQVLLQTRRLKISRHLALGEVLKKELQNFRVQITASAHEVFGAARQGEHDDLVMALALAAWVSEHTPEPYTGPVVYDLHNNSGAAHRQPTMLEEALEAMDREEEDPLLNPWR
jgi:hypothetical protein